MDRGLLPDAIEDGAVCAVVGTIVLPAGTASATMTMACGAGLSAAVPLT